MSAQSRYIVAEITDDGRLAVGAWTDQVFTDRADAFAELADAHTAGRTGLRVYRLTPCRVPAASPHSPHNDDRPGPGIVVVVPSSEGFL